MLMQWTDMWNDLVSCIIIKILKYLKTLKSCVKLNAYVVVKHDNLQFTALGNMVTDRNQQNRDKFYCLLAYFSLQYLR